MDIELVQRNPDNGLEDMLQQIHEIDYTKKEKRIDLGCGNNCHKSFEGLDYKKFGKDVKYVCDLNKGKLPFKSNSVDLFFADQVLEHIDNPINMINECWRCLKVGGKLAFSVPYFSNPQGNNMMHKTYWNLATIMFFDGTYHETKENKWKVLHYECEFEKTSSNLVELWRTPFEWLVSKHPTWYERHFSYACPLAGIKLLVEKE